MCLAVSTEYRRVIDGRTDGQIDRQTDGQTSCHSVGLLRVMHTRRAIKTALMSLQTTHFLVQGAALPIFRVWG